MTVQRVADSGDGAFAHDDLARLSTILECWSLDLILAGHTATDVSGALTTVAVRLLIAADGQEATAQHLHDLADKLKAGTRG